MADSTLTVYRRLIFQRCLLGEQVVFVLDADDGDVADGVFLESPEGIFDFWFLIFN